MAPPEYASDQSDEDLDARLAAMEDRLLAVIKSRLDLSAGLAKIIGAPPQPGAADGDELAVGGAGEGLTPAARPGAEKIELAGASKSLYLHMVALHAREAAAAARVQAARLALACAEDADAERATGNQQEKGDQPTGIRPATGGFLGLLRISRARRQYSAALAHQDKIRVRGKTASARLQQECVDFLVKNEGIPLDQAWRRVGDIMQAAAARKSGQCGDSEVVAAIAAGDPAGLAEAYDRYAGPLYAFCRGILREPADAADVVQDTFVIAAPRMSALRDPERLRSWLYAVARNECLRRRRGLSLQAGLEEAAEVSDEAADVGAGVEKAELCALVRQALPGVGPAEQEVLGLQLRHGMAAEEVAGVLGVSRNHAHALLSRARGQLQAALGALVVARAGRQDCPDLGAMLAGWDGRLTVLLRKRISRHAGRCATCARRRERELTPSMLLGVAPMLGLPLAAALPAGLRDQVLQSVFGSSPAAVAHRAAVGQAPYSFGPNGFPQPVQPLHAPWWQAGPMHIGAAAAVIAAGVLIAVVLPHHPGGHRAGPSAVASGTSPVAAGSRPPSAGSPGAPGNGGAPRASVVVRVSAGATPGAGAPGPSPVTAHTPVPVPVTASASAMTARTLTVSPATLKVNPPASGTITLTASGGPVSWTVSEPPELEKQVVVAPMSGSLPAGGTATITVTFEGSGKPTANLTFSPGGATVTVHIN